MKQHTKRRPIRSGFGNIFPLADCFIYKTKEDNLLHCDSKQGEAVGLLTAVQFTEWSTETKGSSWMNSKVSIERSFKSSFSFHYRIRRIKRNDQWPIQVCVSSQRASFEFRQTFSKARQHDDKNGKVVRFTGWILVGMQAMLRSKNGERWKMQCSHELFSVCSTHPEWSQRSAPIHRCLCHSHPWFEPPTVKKMLFHWKWQLSLFSLLCPLTLIPGMMSRSLIFEMVYNMASAACEQQQNQVKFCEGEIWANFWR